MTLARLLDTGRMNKSQQMRWSRLGADLLLQVRSALYNGTFGSGFGQRFQPTIRSRKQRLRPDIPNLQAVPPIGVEIPRRMTREEAH